jgi:hypothetical protein
MQIINIVVFWVVAKLRFEGGYRCFQGIFRLHLHGTNDTLKTEVVGSSENLATYGPSPEDHNVRFAMLLV